MKVLIADDSALNRKILKSILGENGIESVEAETSQEFMNIINDNLDIGVIVIDIDIEGGRLGINLIDYIKRTKYRNIPVIFTSSYAEKEDIEKGLKVGVFDYILKPIEPYITFLKIKNAMKYYDTLLSLKASEETITTMNKELISNYKQIEELNKSILDKNKILEVKVEERTKELNDMTFALISALENANYYNDEITGNHIRRVSAYSELIAEEAKLDQSLIKEIKIYSSLHDIGKVGIPDSILKKPGKYMPEEFEEMKKHVSIGYNMIKDSPLSEVAKHIVKYHHEKFDGSGYCDGLKGKDIPIEARIVAIADVFDALTTKRSYKEAFTIEKAEEIMYEGKNKHFDGELLDIFFLKKEKIAELMEAHKDEE